MKIKKLKVKNLYNDKGKKKKKYIYIYIYSIKKFKKYKWKKIKTILFVVKCKKFFWLKNWFKKNYSYDLYKKIKIAYKIEKQQRFY